MGAGAAEMKGDVVKVKPGGTWLSAYPLQSRLASTPDARDVNPYPCPRLEVSFPNSLKACPAYDLAPGVQPAASVMRCGVAGQGLEAGS